MFRSIVIAGLLAASCWFGSVSQAQGQDLSAQGCRSTYVCGDFMGLRNCCQTHVIYKNGRVVMVTSNFNQFCSTLNWISRQRDRKQYSVRQFGCWSR